MRDSRCLWGGSCSLCPYVENCPCQDEEFKYYNIYITYALDCARFYGSGSEYIHE